MSFESRGGPAESPGPDGGAPRADGAPRAGSAESGSGPDAPRTGSWAGRRPAELVVEGEEVAVHGIDVAATRSALARLGAYGSTALTALAPEATVELLKELQKLSGAVAAVEARALVQLETAVAEESRRRGEAPKQARKIARAEASLALKRSTSAAGRSMSTCRRLVSSMPGMLTALAHGRSAPAACHQVGRAVGPATPEQRRQVDRILSTHLADLEDCGPGEWGDEAARILHALDPQGASARHREARRERGVTVRRGRHGMATLTAHLGGLDAARIRKNLSVAAEKARAGGDRRGHQQIMADLFADSLLDRGEGGELATLDIGVIITDRSLLAPAHADAATVEGFGPVPYDHIREEMQRALDDEDPEVALALRTLYLDRDDGQLAAAESRAREFPGALARLVRFAHQTCRAPHCEANIRQIDHIRPFSRGGPTSRDNANGLCAADNQKEEAGAGARVITDENGTRRTVEWVTRYGQTARRRGIDFDPVRTAMRKQARARATSPHPEAKSPVHAPPAQTAADPPADGAGERGPLTLLHRLRALPELQDPRAPRESSRPSDAAEGRPAATVPDGAAPAPSDRAGPGPADTGSARRGDRHAGRRRPLRLDLHVLWHLSATGEEPPTQDVA
ncbi:HNH endonuclease [Brachybacterium sp. AOP43-C2-M15]|uniref:HNH endonuclease n=1 Tax=Brachybacterium sp. AOP43-C2-M15 TaxID=3457661 RepID=UPI004033C7F6